MFMHESVLLPFSSVRAVDGLTKLSRRQIAGIAGEATSEGEALLARTGHQRQDAIAERQFGAQLGRPLTRGTSTVFQLRWWNERSRSLTPGFIGEIEVTEVEDRTCQMAVSGHYHPRAHLYELVDGRLIQRMAAAVLRDFVVQLKVKLLEAVDRPAERSIA